MCISFFRHLRGERLAWQVPSTDLYIDLPILETRCLTWQLDDFRTYIFFSLMSNITRHGYESQRFDDCLLRCSKLPCCFVLQASSHDLCVMCVSQEPRIAHACGFLSSFSLHFVAMLGKFGSLLLSNQWPFQVPKLELLYHILERFGEISTYVDILYGRYISSIGSWNFHW